MVAPPIDNLALCCRSCHLHKHVKTEAADPVTGETVPLFNPRTQQWSEHFVLDPDTSEIGGLRQLAGQRWRLSRLTQPGVDHTAAFDPAGSQIGSRTA